MSFDLTQLWLTGPLLVVSAGGMLLLLLESFTVGKATGKTWLAPLSLLVLALAAWLEVSAWGAAETPRTLYNGLLAVDRFSIFLALTFFASAALTLLLA